jgi:hypothetical protein
MSAFIQPLCKVYSLPKQAESNEREFFMIYVELLGKFSDSTLKTAAGNIIAHRQYRTFPLPADCLEACQEAYRSGRPVTESKHRTDAEAMAETAHLDRLNMIANQGDINRAARLMIILLKSHQTRSWDFSRVSEAVQYAVRKKLGLNEDDEVAIQP